MKTCNSKYLFYYFDTGKIALTFLPTCQQQQIRSKFSAKATANEMFLLVLGPTCLRIQAPFLSEIICPESGHDEFPAGTECFIQCKKGFELKGDGKMTCVNNGTWQKDSVECVRKFWIPTHWL